MSSNPSLAKDREPLRTYIITSYTSTRSCQVLDPDSNTVIYSLRCPLTTTKAHPYSQTLHTGPSDESPIVAASMLSWVTTTIKLVFGDPNSSTQKVIWEKMHKNSLLSLNYNHYWFGVDLLGEGKRKEFEWKGTKGEGEEGKVGKVVNVIVKQSMKLVDRGSGQVVARFVSSKGEDGRARLEILRGFRSDGDGDGNGNGNGTGKEIEVEQEGVAGVERAVLMSSLALQEFWRKGSMIF